ncbi:hypothetical protein [Marinobacterium rhizophilum]|uniref:MarR family protein n=1 Tax=Marinobacterium rhizophilum TaxID=420402 RepID=A0ABY5HMD6_9GAMM|nr:hypothetical protein [Marinobacterium rhizophilum]UTW13046.1 hypothetical protein KDW95_05130 [Marinobacterium rhizophilum]
MKPLVSRRFLTRLHAMQRDHIDFTYWLLSRMDPSGCVDASASEMALACNRPQEDVLQTLDTLSRHRIIAPAPAGYRISPVDTFSGQV